MTYWKPVTLRQDAVEELDKFKRKLEEKSGKAISRSNAILCLIDCNEPEAIRKGVK